MAVEEIMIEHYESDLYFIKNFNKKGLYKLTDQPAQKLQTMISHDKLLNPEKFYALKKFAHYQNTTVTILSSQLKPSFYYSSLQKIILHISKNNLSHRSWTIAIKHSRNCVKRTMYASYCFIYD